MNASVVQSQRLSFTDHRLTVRSQKLRRRFRDTQILPICRDTAVNGITGSCDSVRKYQRLFIALQALALACFLGLGPAEIAGLKWGDIDKHSIHIRRNRMQGKVGTTKNKWRMASIPIIDQVRVPLELWRQQATATADSDWLISDLHNLIGRVIKPHVKGDKECVRCEKTPKASGVEWHGLYAGRRGAVTMVIEMTGNVAVAQRLARHKTADTTLRVYNKGISEKGFSDGMKFVSKSLTGEVEK